MCELYILGKDRYNLTTGIITGESITLFVGALLILKEIDSSRTISTGEVRSK